MQTSLILDLVLVVILISSTLRGWRNGLLVTGLGLLGFVLGAGLALWGAPGLIARVDALSGSEAGRSLVLFFVVVVAAIVGQSVLGGVGYRIRTATKIGAVRTIDSLLGSVVALVVTALVVGVLGTAFKPVLPQSWARAVNGSHVLDGIEDALPGQSQRWASQLTKSLDAAGFPRAFSGLTPEPVIPAESPAAGSAQTAGVQRAAASIVRIEADATRCGRQQSGSGWVVAPQRIVTNAHVVAGSTDVNVRVRGAGPSLGARVVAFNPDLDLAVLDVPRLTAPALSRAASLSSSDSAVVAGFPLGGPYRAEAARVRGTIQASGDDIYGQSGVTRQVYALYATARPGNSGGPLLTTDGRVAGTIFARSLVDTETAYALTDRATGSMLDRASSYTSPVNTGACTSGRV